MRPKSPDLGFVLFADHLPDPFIKPSELISYLIVISAQSWELIEAFWNLRSHKLSRSFLSPLWYKHTVVFCRFCNCLCVCPVLAVRDCGALLLVWMVFKLLLTVWQIGNHLFKNYYFQSEWLSIMIALPTCLMSSRCCLIKLNGMLTKYFQVLLTKIFWSG